MDFFKIFKKKDKKLLNNGLNKDVIEGFLDKIEDIICIADSNYQIEYINKVDVEQQYENLTQLLEYQKNKELYNEIINKVKEEGFYTNNVELNKKMKKYLCTLLCIMFKQLKNIYYILKI